MTEKCRYDVRIVVFYLNEKLVLLDCCFGCAGRKTIDHTCIQPYKFIYKGVL